jgi:uncharacterized membrane protein
MEAPQQQTSTTGIYSGSLLVLLFQINSSEWLKTIVLAIVGAVVSYTVTYAIKWLVKKRK